MSSIAILIYLILHMFSDIGSQQVPEHHYVLKRPFGKINATTGQSFVNLLRGDFYIDTTYILKEVLKSHRYKTLAITLPSKWGKSLNLDMMKTFLEIQVDNRGKRILPQYRSTSYKLFHNNQLREENGQIVRLYEPLYISFSNTLLRKHQGRHPVICLDFGNTNASNYRGILQEMANRIKNAYSQHEYMISALIDEIRGSGSTPSKNNTAKKLKSFMQMMHGKPNYEDLINSIWLLSRILYDHFGSKVFILLDNYEGVLLNALTNTAISEAESPLILAFFSSLMVRSFQSNDYMEKGILTGSFKMLNLIPHLNNVTEYKTTQHVMMRLYSIEEEVLMSIFHRLGLPQIRRSKVTNWYGGYHWGSNLCYSVYSPQTVMNFLSTGKVGYLKERHVEFDPVLENMFYHRTVRTYILWLLYSKPILVSQKEIRPQQFLTDFIKFKEALRNSKNPFDDLSIEPYLCAVGILAIARLHGGFGTQVRMPNHAVRMEVAEKLIHFYEKNFNLSISALNEAIENLALFMLIGDNKLEDLKYFLQTITRNEALMAEMEESKYREQEIFELFLCFIFNYFTFRITLSHDYQIESIEKVQLNKWIMFNDYSVTFIQFRMNDSSAEHVLDICKNHATTMPMFTQLPFVKFVGINFRPNGEVDICTESLNGPFEMVSNYTTKPPPIYAV
ncbi:uncharacterized protein LOC135836758 [Planococcus citri]|uniref:uncharacterized protein LOC135836758 n=1 Tax=Planococcus citri TaxID=170843 RepID=UPI0031F7D49E